MNVQYWLGDCSTLELDDGFTNVFEDSAAVSALGFAGGTTFISLPTEVQCRARMGRIVSHNEKVFDVC